MRLLARAIVALVVVLVALPGCATTPASNAATRDALASPTADSLAPESLLAVDERPVESDGVVLWVHGMSCPKCVSNVDITLKRVRGVGDVNINMAQGLVRVGFAGSEHPTPRQLAQAVEDAGLTLVRMEARR